MRCFSSAYNIQETRLYVWLTITLRSLLIRNSIQQIPQQLQNRHDQTSERDRSKRSGRGPDESLLVGALEVVARTLVVPVTVRSSGEGGEGDVA